MSIGHGCIHNFRLDTELTFDLLHCDLELRVTSGQGQIATPDPQRWGKYNRHIKIICRNSKLFHTRVRILCTLWHIYLYHYKWCFSSFCLFLLHRIHATNLISMLFQLCIYLSLSLRSSVIFSIELILHLYSLILFAVNYNCNLVDEICIRWTKAIDKDIWNTRRLMGARSKKLTCIININIATICLITLCIKCYRIDDLFRILLIIKYTTARTSAGIFRVKASI